MNNSHTFYIYGVLLPYSIFIKPQQGSICLSARTRRSKSELGPQQTPRNVWNEERLSPPFTDRKTGVPNIEDLVQGHISEAGRKWANGKAGRKADNERTWDRGLSGNALWADPPGGGDSDPLSHHLPGSFRPSGPRGCQGNSRSATQAQSMQGRKARWRPSGPALRRRSVSVARFRLASGSRP